MCDHSFAVSENGQLVAVMPLQYSPHTKRMTSSGWGGSGPVIRGDLEGVVRERVLRLTLDYARAQAETAAASVLDIAISPASRAALSQHWGVNPFIFYGYRDVSLLSQVVDLSPTPEQLFAALPKKTRYVLRKLSSSGVQIRRVEWRHYLDTYYKVHRETYIRTGVSPHPKSYFAGIACEMAPRGHAVLLAAFSADGEAIAFNNTARFGEGAFYHTGCSRSQALNLDANHLLLWHAMLAAKEDGIRWFDLGTINPLADDPKLKSLSIFKTRFGGEPHRFFRCELTLSSPTTPSVVSSPANANTTMPAPAAPAAKPLFSRSLRGASGADLDRQTASVD